MASKEAVAEVLDDAVVLMQENGWTKGQNSRRDGETTRYCPIGAIRETIAQKYVNADFKIRHGVEKAAVYAIANAWGHYPDVQHTEAVRAVTDWNDHSETKWPMVVRRFRMAKAQILKGKGAP